MGGLELLAEARAAGLSVQAKGDRLIIEGPEEAETIAEKLLENKALILAALASISAPPSDLASVIRSATENDQQAQQHPVPDAEHAGHAAEDCDLAVQEELSVVSAGNNAAESTDVEPAPIVESPKLQVFDEYRYGPRSVLQPGDKFRVTGGAVYENADGTKALMAERGTFTFRRYCVKGDSKWLEAFGSNGSGMFVLWVGDAGPLPKLPSLQRRPYRVRKITDCKQQKKKKEKQARKGGVARKRSMAADKLPTCEGEALAV